MHPLSHLFIRLRRPLVLGTFLCLLASGVPAKAQVIPSQINGPYGQQTAAPAAPAGTPGTTTAPGGPSPSNFSHSVVPGPTPGSGTVRLSPAAEAPSSTAPVTPESTTRVFEALPPVTLNEEPSPEATLLHNVLIGTVTKVQTYPIDLPTVLRLVQTKSLPVAHDKIVAKIQGNTYYRSLSDMLPDFSPTYTHSRFQGVIQVFGNQTVQVYQTRITPQMQFTMTVYPGGQQLFTALAAKRRYAGAKVQVQETLQQQLADAANEYYTLLGGYIQVENLRIGIQEAQSQVALNEARLKAGVGTRLDLARAESELAQQENTLIRAQNAQSQAEQALLTRLDLDPNISLVPTQIVAQPQVLVPMTMTTDELVARAILRNLGLKGNEIEIQALRREGWSILSRVIPSVTLQTYLNETGPSYDKLGEGRFGGLTISTSLFENLGTALPLDYRRNRLDIARQQNEGKQLLRTVQNQVITAYLDSKSSAQSILAAQDELAAAQEAYRLALGRYRAGLGIYVDVLDAQNSLNTARVTLANAILSFNRAQVTLLDAMGEVSPETLTSGLKPIAATGPKATPAAGLKPLPLPASSVPKTSTPATGIPNTPNVKSTP